MAKHFPISSIFIYSKYVERIIIGRLDLNHSNPIKTLKQKMAALSS